jgi:hypothetical protein
MLGFVVEGLLKQLGARAFRKLSKSFGYSNQYKIGVFQGRDHLVTDCKITQSEKPSILL